MSFQDEVERAKKKLAGDQKKLEEGRLEGQKLYLERLDALYAGIAREMQKRDQFFFDQIRRLEILDAVDEMRVAGKLNYRVTYQEVTRQKASFWGSKPVKEMVATPIPAVLEIQREFEAGPDNSRPDTFMYQGVAIRAEHRGASGWQLSSVDFKNWSSYQRWYHFAPSTTEPDFQERLDARIAEIAAIELPVLKGMSVNLTWNYVEGDTDFAHSDTTDTFIIQLTRQVVTVQYKFAAIPTAECSAAWIRQKVAEAYVTYKFH